MKIRSFLLPASLSCLVLSACDSSSSTSPSASTPPVGRIQVGVDTTVSVSGTTVHKFLFTADSGAIYTIQTVGSIDTKLELRDSSGMTIIVSDQQPDSLNGKIGWTAKSTSTVQIDLSAGSTAGGSTILRVRQTGGADAYEPDNTLHTAQPIGTDGTLQIHTLTAGDVDWFKVPVIAGEFYKVVATSDSAVVLQAFAADSSQIVSASNSPHYFKATATGFAYVRVWYGKTTTTGGYSIGVVHDTVDFKNTEPNESSATATLTPTDSTVVLHYLQGNSLDWIKFPVVAGKSYKIRATSSYGMYVTCYADSTTNTSSSDDVTSTDFRATKNGMVFVELDSYDGPPDAGAYKVAVSVDTVGVDAYEPDDLPSQAASIPTDGTVQKHYLQHGEMDWIKFKTDSGTAYLVDYSGLNYPSIRIYADSTGSVSAASGTSAVGFRAKASQTYYAKITGTDTYGPYTVSVVADTNTDAYEPDDTRATASTLTAGSGQRHYLQPGDVDWVKFQADSGTAYTIGLGATSDAETDIYLCDSTGSSLKSGYAWSGLSGSIAYTPAVSGTYYLEVVGNSSWVYGTYSISLAKK